MSDNRAARRRAQRDQKRTDTRARRMNALTNLRARHGVLTFMYDRNTDTHHVLNVDAPPPIADVFPDTNPDTHSIAGHLGVADPDDILGWVREVPWTDDMVGTRCLVWACCEHVRDDAADTYGWRSPELDELFDDNPADIRQFADEWAADPDIPDDEAEAMRSLHELADLLDELIAGGTP